MNVVENEVGALIEKELAAANERFPAFASPHEGYAVMLEEYKEAQAEVGNCGIHLHKAWERIKDNQDAVIQIGITYDVAVRGICEMIQFAAMARKFMALENNP